MFRCERCGSSYSSTRIVGIEHCPRCLLKDETLSPLSLKVFDLPQPGEAATSASKGPGAPSSEAHLQSHGGAVGT